MTLPFALPTRSPGRFRRAISAVLLAGGLLPGGAHLRAEAPKTPQPTLKIALASLGFPGYSLPFLDAGSSMISVHFVDNSHLLVTFSTRGLLERIAEDPEEDEDRVVAAKLLELPSGKVLAETRWRLHDHGQYVWAIGGGRFLLRTRSTLVAFAPLANLASGDAFRQTPFAHLSGQIDGLIVSPDSEIVTIDSSKPKKKAGPTATTVGAVNQEPAAPEPMRETVIFVRPVGAGTPSDPIRAVSAGAVRADAALSIPLNGRGYMFADKTKGGRWQLAFESFDGTTHALAPIDSMCAPRLHLVSYSQFIAFTCRTSDPTASMLVSAWDFAPHEMWEEPLSGVHAFAFTTYAPGAGRFALSRTNSVSAGAGGSPGSSAYGSPSVSPEQLGSQEIRVYQTESGDLLLKLNCFPIIRTGQNFDLAPDGMSLVAVRGPNLELYALPPLSKADQKDLAELRALEPPPVALSRVTFRNKVKAAVQEAETAEHEGQPAPPASDTPAAPPTSPATAAAASARAAGLAEDGGNVSGDAPTRRKPPTLLNDKEAAEGQNAPQPPPKP